MLSVHGLSSILAGPFLVGGQWTLLLPGRVVGAPGLPMEQVIGSNSWSSVLFQNIVFSTFNPADSSPCATIAAPK